MLDQLEALRKKPKHVRNKYAFGIASLVTLIIVGVWVFTLPAQFEEIFDQEVTETPDNSSSLRERWGSVTQRTSELFASLRDQLELEVAEEQSVEEVDFRTILASSTIPVDVPTTTVSSTTASTTEGAVSASTTAPIGE